MTGVGSLLAILCAGAPDGPTFRELFVPKEELDRWRVPGQVYHLVPVERWRQAVADWRHGQQASQSRQPSEIHGTLRADVAGRRWVGDLRLTIPAGAHVAVGRNLPLNASLQGR